MAKRAPAIQCFDIKDLATALVEAHTRRNWPEENRTYFELRAKAFSDAFGVSKSSDRYLPDFLRQVLDAAVAHISPFAGMLEAPRSIVRYHEEFGGRLRAAEDRLQDEVRALLHAVLRELSKGRETVTDADLLKHGFDVAMAPPASDDWSDW